MYSVVVTSTEIIKEASDKAKEEEAARKEAARKAKEEESVESESATQADASPGVLTYLRCGNSNVAFTDTFNSSADKGFSKFNSYSTLANNTCCRVFACAV
jgi:hypothetical protein